MPEPHSDRDAGAEQPVGTYSEAQSPDAKPTEALGPGNSEAPASGDEQTNVQDTRKLLTEQRKTIKNQDIEIFQLKNELEAIENLISEEPDLYSTVRERKQEAGKLPDFIVLGVQKGGTTSLYDLLVQHPEIESPPRKELRFFDANFDKGTEWYRKCFPVSGPQSRQKFITGEATTQYLHSPNVPERMAQVLPEALLVALLRNPVDRAYSHYNHEVWAGRENRSFEKIVEVESSKPSKRSKYLARGIYVDHLQRWLEHFSEDQLLILKSEDFFEHTTETLRVVTDFFGLPEWTPETTKISNKSNYTKAMDPAVREQLEKYFRPHNQRLYDFLNVDFGW